MSGAPAQLVEAIAFFAGRFPELQFRDVTVRNVTVR
jgi:hypothetical protein